MSVPSKPRRTRILLWPEIVKDAARPSIMGEQHEAKVLSILPSAGPCSPERCWERALHDEKPVD